MATTSGRTLRAAAGGLLLAALALGGCGNSKKTVPSPATVGGPDQTVPVTITGPGGVEVTVPPGASATPITVAIALAPQGTPAPPSGFTAAGPAFEITPHGARFQQPVTLRLPVDPAAVPAGAEFAMLKANPAEPWAVHLGARRVGDAVELEVRDFSFVAPVTLPAGPERFSMSMEIDDPSFMGAGGWGGVWYLFYPSRPVPTAMHLRVNRLPPGTDRCGIYLESGLIVGNRGESYLERVRTAEFPVDVTLGHGAYYFPLPDGLNGPSQELHPGSTHASDTLKQLDYIVTLRCHEIGQATADEQRSFFPGLPGIVGFPSFPVFRIGFTRETADATVLAGDTAAFSARVVGGNWDRRQTPLSNSLEWLRSDDGGETWQRIGWAVQAERDAQGLSWLHVRDVRPSDDGALFRMRACYQGTPADDPIITGQISDCALSRSARLTVLPDAAPAFTLQPSPVSVAVGQLATFAAAASGVPAPTFQWQRLDPGAAAWADVAGAASASYTTPATAEEQTGTQYRVVATSRAGSANSDPATLTVQGTPPAVLLLEPADGVTNVSTGAVVTATFSEPVAPATVTSLSFALAAAGSPVAGEVAVSGSVATFTPSAPLSPGVTYTATLDSTISDLHGNAMGAPRAWSFTTVPPPDTTPPTVAGTSPPGNGSGVAADAVVTATFSEPVDPATVTATTFSLTLVQTGAVVAGSLSVAGATVTFTPAAPLSAGSEYAVRLGAAIADLAGNPLGADHTWSFFTAAATPAFLVGGSVTGLTGAGLVLRNNGGDDVAISADGPFAFATRLIAGASYAVTVATQPAGQTCAVAGGNGTVGAADVTAVAVSCSAGPSGAPAVTASYGVKQVSLTWAPVAGAAFYRVWRSPDGLAPMVQQGGDLLATSWTTDVAVHAERWGAATWRVEACDAATCLSSLTLTAPDSLQAIGLAKATNTGAGDRFGGSVALSADGNTLAVGATGEGSDAAGVGGDQASDALPDSGAVYMYVRTAAGWALEAYLKSLNPQADDHFGASLALSGDGNTLAIGMNSSPVEAAPNACAVQIYVRSAGTWSAEWTIASPYADTAVRFGGNESARTVALPFWGATLALSHDGNTLAVGAPQDASGATGIDGNEADVSAPGSGAVHVYLRSGTDWARVAYVKASNTGAYDLFGTAVALSSDGTTLAVGAWGESSASPGVDGDQSDNSATSAGAVYVFTQVSGAWAQQAYVKASNPDGIETYSWSPTDGDAFGLHLALSADGNRMAVAAPFEGSNSRGVNGDQADNSVYAAGAAYLFTRSGSTWSQEAYLKASNTPAQPGPTPGALGSGISLSADGATLVVGAAHEASLGTGLATDQTLDPVAGYWRGAAYVFTLQPSGWAQAAFLKASNNHAQPLAFPMFGWSIATSADGSTIAVGALGEDSAATGVSNQRWLDSGADSSGAVYLY